MIPKGVREDTKGFFGGGSARIGYYSQYLEVCLLERLHGCRHRSTT